MQFRSAILALIFSAGPLSAGTITTYTNKQAFIYAAEAINQPHTTIETDSLDGPDKFNSPNGPDTSIPGVSIQDWSDFMSHWPAHITSLSNGVLHGCVGHGCGVYINVSTTWTFAAPIYAFGANFTYPSGDISNGLVFCYCYSTSPSIPYQNGFAGIISDTPFSQITFGAADRLTPPPDCPFCQITQTFTMDNLIYESSAPEPGTDALLLIAVGFGIAPILRSRRKEKMRPRGAC